MKKTPQMHRGYARPVPQDFASYNGGSAFMPAGRIAPPIGLAVAATPHFGPMMAASAPVTYARPFATARAAQVAMITPKIGAVSPR